MQIISILIPIFAVIGLGFICVWFKLFSSEDSRIFSKYDYYVGFPILIFYALAFTDFEQIKNWPLFATNIVAMALAVALILLASFVFRVKREFIGVLVLAGLFSNVAYMGIPINEMLFGKEGVSYASIVIAIVNIFCLTIGIFCLEYFAGEKMTLPKMFLGLAKNPILIAVVAGIVASALNMSFPAPIAKFLDFVGKSASPIALFAIGMFLGRTRATVVNRPSRGGTSISRVAALCLVNLIVLPVLIYLVGRTIGFSDLPFKVSLVEAAMPLAATNFVLAQQHHVGEDVVASSIVVSTLISAVTIALLIFLFNAGIV